jgi:hypothetical protein
MTPQDEPEYASVEALAEFLMDDNRDSFSVEDVIKLAERTQGSNLKIIHELKAYGLKMVARQPVRVVRGFKSNSHDRWTAYPSHGGSGWEQITGCAGKPG